jgi:hypothetical protein
MRNATQAFTFVEILTSVAVLAAVVLSVTRLFSNTVMLATFVSKRMESDGQARPLLDRIGIDLAQMLKRSDVDYYVKTPHNVQRGNDQLAFYSTVPGYYPSTGSQSPLSLVSYRINTQYDAERLGKGLLWTGVSTGSTPLVFLPQTIAANWPAATNNTADSDYEIVAANVFRFEYFFWLTNGHLSDAPWDTGAGHDAVHGMQDVSAISVAIAAIDPKSRVLLSDIQVATIAARMNDFDPSMGPGDLLVQWQRTLDTSHDIPRSAVAGIRTYQRHFQLLRRP